MTRKLILLLPAILAAASCNTLKHGHYSVDAEEWAEQSLPNDLAIDHTMYVFGEMGAGRIESNPLAEHIKKTLAAADENSSAIFLGSHLYPKGLSGKKKNERSKQEAELRRKFRLLDGFAGDYYFISGEHDWEYRGDLGLKAVNRMEDFFEDELDAKDFFLPEKGCAGPIKVKYEPGNRDIVLLFINTQWWLEDWQNEPGINKGCDVKSKNEFIDRLQEVILKNKNKHLVIVMHHPLFSEGVHGGNIPGKYHFFPLTEVKPKAWLPMPLLGSAAAGHRKITGSKQDISHPEYTRLKDEILKILTVYRLENFFFLSAHDHALQYFHEADNHFIVSGSAGGEGFARRGGNAEFASAKSGFSKLIFYENKEVWLEFLALEDGKLELQFRKLMKQGASNEEDVLARFDFEPIADSVTAIAGPSYDVKKFRRFWFGKTYRDVWSMPLKIPTLDISTEHGGLTPLRKGGGQQSNSLRLEDGEGKQYVFRSIYKSAYKTTPEFARGTWAQNVMQDLLSASHPYGAFTVPTMSKAAKIYYTEPKLVYIPKQPALGFYNESFGDAMYLYEDRPTGNRKDLDGFGNSKKIIGINELLPKLQDNTDHVVDQKFVLRSRLFDVWLHDWDRHDDQWRWASDKKDGKTVYRPIPRDRDQVYFTFDGPLPWLVSNLILKKFRTFKHTLKKPQHQSFNAKHFDRYFLTEMELDEWLDEAEKLQERLTDSVIHKAFEVWPDEVYDDGAEEIIEKLKSRREDLPNMAEGLYMFLAKEVNVLGTNEDDKFKVRRNRRGTTEVKVYELSKKGKKKDKYYSRTFDPDETKEIRLYGMGGDDEFEIDGKGRKGIVIRIIGGGGKDIVDDDSRVRGVRKLTRIYDEKEGIIFDKGKEIQDRTSDRYDINDYDRQEFLYNSFFPVVNFGSNIDDGFFFGGGFTSTLHGWRKDPYKAKHGVGLLWAPKTNAFEFHYNMHRVGTFYRLNSDLTFKADLLNPYYMNYYGQGNESIFDKDKDSEFYWVRLIDYRIALGLRKDWVHGRYSLELAPVFQSSKVVVVEDRVSEAPEIGLSPSDKERKNFLGGEIIVGLNAVESDGARAVDGIALNLESEYLNLPGKDDQYSRLSGEAKYYLTFFKKLPTTFATRIGASANFGDVPFYHSDQLGGDNYLRGYRGNRYSGKYLFYHNIDLRVRLVDWDNKILPMEIGLLGGFDYGRVWEPGEESDELHKGYTAGLWLTPFTVASLTFNYSFGEENLFSFGFGFFF